MKNTRIFLSENFHFLVVNFSVYLNKHVFVMICKIEVMTCIYTFLRRSLSISKLNIYLTHLWYDLNVTSTDFEPDMVEFKISHF